MAKAKQRMTYCKLFFDYLDAIELLGDAERGRLFTALLEYGRTGEAPQLGGNERFIFPMMKAQIDRDSENTGGNMGIAKGEAHWNWKGGITPANQRGRNSTEYTQWRKAVFERDGFVCQACGKRGGKLNAHHRKPWAKFLALRYDVENGITLCEPCHKKEHSKHG